MARRNAIAAWMTRLKPILGGLLILMGVLILTGGALAGKPVDRLGL